MASQTQGIQQLLGAEKRAAEKVKRLLLSNPEEDQSEKRSSNNCLGEWGQKEEEQEAEAGQGGGEKANHFISSGLWFSDCKKSKHWQTLGFDHLIRFFHNPTSAYP